MTFDGETTAWLFGIGVGGGLGAVATYGLHRNAFDFGRAMMDRAATLRGLLQDLQTAEGRYRQKYSDRGNDHPETNKAWLEMRDAGNAARLFIMTGRKK